jgi:aspartate aminotransferase-like enzyme
MGHKRLWIPGPVEVHPEILQACAVPMISHRGKDYQKIHSSAKAGLRKMLGTEKGQVYLFTSSSTGAMEGALRNLCAKRVLSCTCGNFSERWHEIALENGKESDKYGVEWGQPNRPEEIDRLLSTGKYDCLTLVSNETSTGLFNPLRDIAAVVKKYPDVSFAVDAVSSLAGIPINPEELGIDFLLAGTQKAFGLPPGLAVVWASDKAMQKSAKVPNRGHYFDLHQFKKTDEKNETPETPVISLIYALDVQMKRMQAEGFENRWKRHRDMAQTCQDWANDRFKMFPAKGYWSTTVSCIENTRKDVTVKELYDKLYERGATISEGYGKLKEKTFRIAHMADTQLSELKELLGWIDDIIGVKK